MPKRRYKQEDIVAKLRQVDVLAFAAWFRRKVRHP